MRNKINELLKKNLSLNELSKELNLNYFDILKECDKVREYDINKIDHLFDVLRGWEKVFLLVVTPNFVLEIKDKFPSGVYAHGFLNFHDKTTSIGGHLSVGNIKHIFLVEDFMFGRKSYSIKFFSEDKKEIFAVYLPRNEKKEVIPQCLEDFYNL